MQCHGINWLDAGFPQCIQEIRHHWAVLVPKPWVFLIENGWYGVKRRGGINKMGL